MIDRKVALGFSSHRPLFVLPGEEWTTVGIGPKDRLLGKEGVSYT